MAKKVSKFFRIGVEGDTCDGREIDVNDIKQMAQHYSPKVRGARINLEHIKSVLPTSDFRRYGDVVELKAEQIDEPDEPLLHGKWALYARLTPTPDLVAMVAASQKIYTSMEIRRDFAKTGSTYLMGLAVTDDPASLGSEMLEFSQRAQKNPLAGRKSDPENLFTAATEALIEFDEITDPENSFSSRIKAMFTRKQAGDDVRFNEMESAVMTVAEQVQEAEARFTQTTAALNEEIAGLKQQIETGNSAFSELKAELSTTENFSQKSRPEATGGNGAQDVMTDC
ncbi:GPO family capsid scaffolding protein [Serratia quinivorans]|uniref:GPO family capsid scaffolding protein n=1 Tax=Serratia quinivorans TaxID=137545 RepID=UPI00217AC989|nr:GPO family capsid scaffolding protein [Serratia quinivorans]CAI1020427.1 Phage capsid scaffolding protein (GPO) serine peptidase [Serratia quinivorans]